MVNNLYKNRVSKLIANAKEKGLIKKYEEFSESEEGKNLALSKEEVDYYTSKRKGETK